MQVDILTPEKKIFSGRAKGVKLPGSKGSFEVLYNHAPIISALDKGDVRVRTDEGDKHFEIKGGFVEALNNRVTVLIEGLKEKQPVE